MTSTLRQLAPRLVLLLSLAGVASGCAKRTPDSASQGAEADKPSSVAQASTPASPREKPSPQQQTPATHWLEQAGILGASNGDWLSISALAFGVLGTGLGIRGWRQANRIQDEQEQQKRSLSNRKVEINNITMHVNSMTRPMEVQKEQIAVLQNRLMQLETQQQSLRAIIHQLQNQAVSSQQTIDSPPTNLITQVPESPPPPTAAQVQVELTAAFNLGGRQAYKNQIFAQLNITSASENDIAMGRLTQTQLEEVTGGGSYWMANIAGEAWLYPTELTLKGFAQFQPAKGIFNYKQETIGSPKVLAPARLVAAGSCWQIAEPGCIAIPG